MNFFGSSHVVAQIQCCVLAILAIFDCAKKMLLLCFVIFESSTVWQKDFHVHVES